jgi:hypothetical protein
MACRGYSVAPDPFPDGLPGLLGCPEILLEGLRKPLVALRHHRGCQRQAAHCLTGAWAMRSGPYAFPDQPIRQASRTLCVAWSAHPAGVGTLRVPGSAHPASVRNPASCLVSPSGKRPRRCELPGQRIAMALKPCAWPDRTIAQGSDRRAQSDRSIGTRIGRSLATSHGRRTGVDSVRAGSAALRRSVFRATRCPPPGPGWRMQATRGVSAPAGHVTPGCGQAVIAFPHARIRLCTARLRLGEDEHTPSLA